MEPANPHSTKLPTLPKEWPQISKQGLRVVTSKRVDVWHGFQLVKCHYAERWATFSSLTPGFPPAPSLLGCWHGSQPPSWHRSFVLAWLREGFWWHPVSARWACLLWPHHGPLKQDWFVSDGKSWISLLRQLLSFGGEVQGAIGRQAEGELGDVQHGSAEQEDAC